MFNKQEKVESCGPFMGYFPLFYNMKMRKGLKGGGSGQPGWAATRPHGRAAQPASTTLGTLVPPPDGERRPGGAGFSTWAAALNGSSVFRDTFGRSLCNHLLLGSLKWEVNPLALEYLWRRKISTPLPTHCSSQKLNRFVRSLAFLCSSR